MRPPGEGNIARLSRAALRAAEGQRLDDVRSVARFLYEFNSADLTGDRACRYTDGEAVTAALGVGPETVLRSILERHWVQVDSRAVPGWLVWTARTRGDELGAHAAELKLYVSPSDEALGRAFESLVEVLASGRAHSFKVGADLSGLLRPDKIVVYFSDLGDLTAIAHRLADKLRGLPAQGVPFTSEICCEGLLSWSVDPPATSDSGPGPPLSWRTWIADRAARALVAAQRDGDPGTAPWRRALEQLSREGMDVERWIPSARQWSNASEWR